MAVEDTLTSGATSEDGEAGRRLVLILAFHPSPVRLGQVVPIPSDGLRIGRDHPDSRLGLRSDKRMSRSHAEFLYIRGQLVVHDLKSRNGTWLNGKRVTHAELRPGDVVRMGSIALVVQEEPPEATVPAGMVGAGPAFKELCRQIEAYAPQPSVVLLEGEAGVGKGLVARALHAASGRRGPFVTFDCGAVSPGVMHSELFGHRAGAFSGAAGARRGLIEEATGGTLFLDEIGDASPELQSSLLRLLEEGEYRPVGADRPRKAAVRVVAATNRDLDAGVEADAFRFDLLTRLRRLCIHVPPLRERIEDVPLLATRFASRYAGRSVTLHRQLAFELLGYRWPGNVRELDAVMERAVVLSAGDSVLRFDRTLFVGTPRIEHREGRGPAPQPGSRPSPTALRALLARHGGNVTHVARELGVARYTLYRWIRDAQIALEDYR